MKNWASALFPLSIFVVLTGLSFWLRYATALDEAPRDGKFRHDPDYIVYNATLRKLDQTGNLQYTLTTDEVRHYPDDDTTEMTLPKLVYLSPSKPTVTVRSDRAHITSGGDRVDLYDNVRVTRDASAKREEMNATMPDLTVFPDDEKGFTKSPVLMTEGKSWAKGVGMNIDYKKQTYSLESQVVAQLESKQTKKKSR